MRKTVLAISLVAAACSPGETAGSTTTVSPEPAPTTTAAGQVTTTAPAGTTTSPTPSTTTVPSTTSLPVSTTMAPALEGNWADEPLVATGFSALGWWDGSNWRDAETEGALPVTGGEDYQTIVLDQLGRTTGGPQTILCEPLGLLGVDLADQSLLGDYPGPYGVAISAPWALQPYLFEAISDDGTYAGFAAEILSGRGMEVAEPVIKQLFRTDIEGDGVNEVLVVAEEVTEGLLLQVGDYSIAFMRKVVDGQVQTAILGDTVVLSEDEQFAGAHSFGGVADLNGDGQMEIIANSAFFEGFNVTAWEYIDDDIGAVIALETGCGV